MSDQDEKRELAEGARPWLEEKALGRAILEARKDWFNMMMSPSVGDGQAIELRNQMLALERVAQYLTKFVNDYKNQKGNRQAP